MVEEAKRQRELEEQRATLRGKGAARSGYRRACDPGAGVVYPQVCFGRFAAVGADAWVQDPLEVVVSEAAGIVAIV